MGGEEDPFLKLRKEGQAGSFIQRISHWSQMPTHAPRGAACACLLDSQIPLALYPAAAASTQQHATRGAGVSPAWLPLQGCAGCPEGLWQGQAGCAGVMSIGSASAISQLTFPAQ